MKTSISFALKNIKRYFLSSLGRSVLLFALTFVVVVALMFSISITNSISGILNSRSSGNTILVNTNESELKNISDLPYIKEVVVYPEKTFTSGEVIIEDIGTFHINCSIIKSQYKNSLVPQTYVDEFNNISGENLLLAGRLPENNSELIINSKYIDDIQIYDYNQVLGKKISIYHQYFDDTVYDVYDSVIVGVYSNSLLDITALSSINNSACCFLLDNSLKYGGKLITYCDLQDMEKASIALQTQYGETNIVKSTITTIPFNELINISSFVKHIMLLVCLVICLVYIVVQIIVVTNYLHEKKDFVTAIKAFGLKDKNLVSIFLFEYLIVSIIPFILSSVLSVVFTKSISYYVSILSGIRYDVTVSVLPIILSFVILLAISLITICIGVYSNNSIRNE
ncbi:MAG: ABC transporter permease [Clostridiales bacterium]|nr:ABC transporter permease [Clostridiales bacterium]